MKRIFCILIAALLAVTLLASCADSASTDMPETASSAGAETTEGDTRIYPDLPDTNFEGAECRILVNLPGAGDWEDWGSRDIIADEENGEPINDAVYKRNLAVMDRYNVKINGIAKQCHTLSDATKKMVLAGTDDYHIVTDYLKSIISNITSGYHVDLATVNNMDLSKIWYDQQCVIESAVMGKVFFITGDMILIDDDATAAMLFNKKVLTDYNLPDPYQYVKNDEWTYENFCAMWQGVGKDLDGNGEITVDDQFGLVWQSDATIAFLHALGGRIASLDNDKLPVYTLEGEICYRIFDAVGKYLYNTDLVINCHDYSSKYANIYHMLQDPIFTENRTLFNWVRLRVVENYRNMETDFGILPMPKYDESQDSYYHTVNSNTCNTIEIPNSAGIDPDFSGFIIEAMSAESTYTLKKAYYDITLNTKITRDEESKEMLDIIFTTRVYDTGEIYNWGGVADAVRSIMQTKKTNYLSTIEKYTKPVAKQIEKFIKTYEKLQ